MRGAPALLTLKDLQARYGGVSQMTLWRWCAQGRLPKPFKFGRAKNAKGFWRLDDILECEAKQQERNND